MKQFEDSRYWVSRDGEVSRYYPERKYDIGCKRSDGTYKNYRIIPEKLKSLKPVLGNCGYYRIGFCLNGISKMLPIHRLVAETYIPGYFKGAHVDHIDCNKLNNHYTNLQWCTPKYNNTKKNNITFPLYSEWSK